MEEIRQKGLIYSQSIWAETAAHWTMLLTEQCCSGKLKMILNEDEETILKKPHKTPTLNTN